MTSLRLDDPRLAQEITGLVDRRVDAALAATSQVRYGTVSAVDATAQKATVSLAGGSPSPGFSWAPADRPKVGDRVRVRVAGADRYIEANLSGGGGLAATPDLGFRTVWYTQGAAISLTADTETDVHSSFRATYPGNPSMTGMEVYLRPWASIQLTLSVPNVEIGLVQYASVSPLDHSSTRLRWVRTRYPATASVMQFIHSETAYAWPAGSSVEFKVMLRCSAAASATLYGNATAQYVSQMGYQVIGYGLPASRALGRPTEEDE